MSLSNMMRKAAGLLVEMPPESSDMPYLSGGNTASSDDLDTDLPSQARLNGLQPRSVEDIVREAQGPNLDEIQVDETQISTTLSGAPSGVLSGDSLDFAAIYRAASLAPTAFGAEQMLETLQSLPSELPLETRRATVRAMLATLGKATGATPESVVADASRKLAALESFENYMARKTTEAVAKNDAEIAELELQIDAKREAIQKVKGELLRVQNGCEAESDRLDDVLEFFSLDVGVSKYAPPAVEGQNPVA